MRSCPFPARLGRIAALTPVGFLLDIPSAAAYLDPGTGSLALQMLIGGAAAVVAGFATYRDKLLGWLRRSSGGSKADRTPDASGPAPTGDDEQR